MTSVGEERRFNPRLGGEISETDFAGYMNNLHLPHPKQIDVAVPANLRCGEPANEAAALSAQDWAPLTYTFAGIWELAPQALEEVGAQVQIVDVREPDEYTGPLGHIRNAQLHVLPNTGHWAQLEQPERFRAQVELFLGEPASAEGEPPA